MTKSRGISPSILVMQTAEYLTSRLPVSRLIHSFRVLVGLLRRTGISQNVRMQIMDLRYGIADRGDVDAAREKLKSEAPKPLKRIK